MSLVTVPSADVVTGSAVEFMCWPGTVMQPDSVAATHTASSARMQCPAGSAGRFVFGIVTPKRQSFFISLPSIVESRAVGRTSMPGASYDALRVVHLPDGSSPARTVHR